MEKLNAYYYAVFDYYEFAKSPTGSYNSYTSNRTMHKNSVTSAKNRLVN